MSKRDFHFLWRKESFIFIFLLLSLAAFLFTTSLIHGQRESNPIISINLPNLKFFALMIPLLILIWILWRLNFPFNVIKKISIGIVAFLCFIVISSIILNLIGIAYNFEDEEESPFDILTTTPALNSTEPTSTESVTDTTTTTQEKKQSLYNIPLLGEIQGIFLFFVILISIVIILRTERRKNRKQFMINQTQKETPRTPKKLNETAKNVIECYYQSSESLESRGADKAAYLTPKEFLNDTLEKDLTETPIFGALTDLFTEAKFSDHMMNEDSIIEAKRLSGKIISGKSSQKSTEEQE